MLHLVDFFTDHGIASTAATMILASVLMFAKVGKLANGVLSARIGGRQAITAFLPLQTCIVLCFIGAGDLWQYYVIVALFGIGMGGPMPTYALLLREFFGQQVIGSILGVSRALSATGMALGGDPGGSSMIALTAIPRPSC